MKYLNHWPSPISTNVARLIASACLVVLAIRNAAAVSQRLQHPERDVKCL
jgi:hypothetical protein